MTLREDLSDYVERSSDLIEESPQMDEQNTKRKVIEPLIELLGWDILSTEVELEYSVQMGTGTKKVDYALKLEGTPVVFIEAKGCDTTLTDSHRDQLRSYMRQVGVDWGILTNGREFEIFRRDNSSNRPNEISLAEFSIETTLENSQPLKAVSRESIDTGESRQIAEKIESIQQAVETLQTNKEDVAEEVTRVVTNVVGEAVSQPVEDEAKNFVDDLILTLEEQAHKPSVERKTSDIPETDTEQKYGIQLLQNGTEQHRVSGETQAKAMAELVDYLIEDQDLLAEIEIPYIPGRGKGKRALINDEPAHPNGEEMRLYEELSNGYYLFTSINSKSKIRYASELTEKMGLGCEFTGGW